MRTRTKVIIGVGVVAAVGGLILAGRKRGMFGGVDQPTRDRIGDLQDSVWNSVKSGQMRELALAITGYDTRHVTVGKHTFDVKGAGCAPRDGQCEAHAVGTWVAKNALLAHKIFADVPYGPDRGAAGTCALLSLNGITCKLRAARRPDGTTTIYSLAGLPKLHPAKWPAVDTQLGNHYAFGREQPRTHFEDFDG